MSMSMSLSLSLSLYSSLSLSLSLSLYLSDSLSISIFLSLYFSVSVALSLSLFFSSSLLYLYVYIYTYWYTHTLCIHGHIHTHLGNKGLVFQTVCFLVIIIQLRTPCWQKYNCACFDWWVCEKAQSRTAYNTNSNMTILVGRNFQVAISDNACWLILHDAKAYKTRSYGGEFSNTESAEHFKKSSLQEWNPTNRHHWGKSQGSKTVSNHK